MRVEVEDPPPWLRDLLQKEAFDKEARGLSEDIAEGFYEVFATSEFRFFDIPKQVLPWVQEYLEPQPPISVE